MDAGKYDLVFTEQFVLARFKLFYLRDEIAGCINFFLCINQLRALFHICLIRESRTFARALLNVNLIAVTYQHAYLCRGCDDTVLAYFDVFQYANFHNVFPPCNIFFFLLGTFA